MQGPHFSTKSLTGFPPTYTGAFVVMHNPARCTAADCLTWGFLSVLPLHQPYTP